MIELLDPQEIDFVAYDQGILSDIRKFSLLPENKIGWNYCMDYTWLAMRFHDVIMAEMRVIDIGCGPGAIHGYLEDIHNIDIIGIDMHRWECDYVDVVGNFADENFRRMHNFDPNSVDVIISTSAFEHNTPEDHRRLVEVCLKSLKPGGHLITTLTAAPGRTRRIGDHWDLSKQNIEKIYGESFKSFNYRKVWWRWRKHREIPVNYKKRYNKWFLWDPLFVSVGADIVAQ